MMGHGLPGLVVVAAARVWEGCRDWLIAPLLTQVLRLAMIAFLLALAAYRAATVLQERATASVKKVWQRA
jgi:hypothetical protein